MMDLPPYEQLLAQSHNVAAEVRPAQSPARLPPDLRWRNTAIIAGSAAVMGSYGYHTWWRDGFTARFRARREGGFGRDTEFSGADKLGHVYFAYLGTRALAPVFELAGNAPDSSRRLSAWTVWGAMGAVEILDGFSRNYRFSYEDLIANTIGAGIGYFLAASSEWDDVIDFRLAYRQTPLSNWDPPGDYAGQRYWLMVKADGIRALRDLPVLRYLEAGVGYGAPGVDTPDEWKFHDFALRRREVFVGVSLNLSRVLADLFYGGRRSSTLTQRVADQVFEFVQHPAMTYRGRDLDRHIPPPVCCHAPSRSKAGSPGR